MIVVHGEKIGIGRYPADGIHIKNGERMVNGNSSRSGLIVGRSSEDYDDCEDAG